MVTNKLQEQIKQQEKNNNLATENNISSLPTKKKNQIFIEGDSSIENITGTVILSDHTMQISSHPGATDVDMWDYIKSELCHQPDVTILQCRANDILNEINTLKKLKKLFITTQVTHIFALFCHIFTLFNLLGFFMCRSPFIIDSLSFFFFRFSCFALCFWDVLQFLNLKTKSKRL